jgi:DnaK suppressor protein
MIFRSFSPAAKGNVLMAKKSTGKVKPSTSSRSRPQKGARAERAAATPKLKKGAKSPPRHEQPAPKPKKKPKPITIISPKMMKNNGPLTKGGKPTKEVEVHAGGKKGKGNGGPDAKSDALGKGKRTRTVAEAASAFTADSKGYVFINGRRVRIISTKGQVPPKKPRANGQPTQQSEAAELAAVKAIKTKLSKKELGYYRDLLLHKRRELVGDLHAMENEALRSGGGNLSHMPIHMADIGTDTFDQDFMLGLAAAERDQLREIDAALQRIEERTYGVCQLTGEQIPKSRLDAKPWAKYTIEAARKMESQLGT